MNAPAAPRQLKICILGAGAAGMICGSCLRDNALAVALQKLGHDATLVPLYTPLKVDTAATATSEDVYFGGINVYLQHSSWLFRHTPRFVDWFLDRPGLLKVAGNLGAGTPPAKLAGMTKGMIKGARGAMAKELGRLVEMLRHLKPDVISLPNLMMAGIAETLHEQLKVPIIVELTGEDIFFEAMESADQSELRELIRGCLPHVAGLVSTSNYYTQKMTDYLAVVPDRVVTVYPGVPQSLLEMPATRTVTGGANLPIIGHFARIDPVKGLDIAQAAVDRVNDPIPRVNFQYAGWDSPLHRKWHAQLRAAAKHPGTYLGEVDMEGKVRFLDDLTLFLATAPYAEPKALYVMEAMARGTPVIAANHGAFAEILGSAGVLVPPGDVAAFARAITELLADEPRRAAMSAAAREIVRARFTDEHMARAMLAFYGSLL